MRRNVLEKLVQNGQFIRGWSLLFFHDLLCGRFSSKLQPLLLKILWDGCDVFDFDRVEVVRATDQEVELFVVQVRNDSDRYRQGRYGAMQCRVRSSAGLSENTMRVLKATFGKVVIEA